MGGFTGLHDSVGPILALPTHPPWMHACTRKTDMQEGAHTHRHTRTHAHTDTHIHTQPTSLRSMCSAAYLRAAQAAGQGGRSVPASQKQQ